VIYFIRRLTEVYLGKIAFLTEGIDPDVFSAVRLVLEIFGSEVSVEGFVASRILFDFSPSLVDIVAVVSSMIVESRSVSVRERLVGYLASFVGETEDVVASLGISV